MVIKFTDLYIYGRMTAVYGPAASGKSSLALKIAMNYAREKSKVLIISTENELIVDRIKRENKLSYIDFVIVRDFYKQHFVITRLLETLIKVNNYKLLIIDTINGLMRVYGNLEEAIKMLNIQLATLACICKNYVIPAIVTGQVRAIIEGKDNEYEATAKNILEYWASILIRLEIIKGRFRRIVVEKHIFNKEIEGISSILKLTGDDIVELYTVLP